MANIVGFALFASPGYYFTLFADANRADRPPPENHHQVIPDSVPQIQAVNNYNSYRKLDASKNEIRLVEVAPGMPGDPIYCRIGKYGAPLTTGDIEYSAVSYCWGDPQLTREINVLQVDFDANGSPSPCTKADFVPFNVTSNLYNLLERVRHNPYSCVDGQALSERLWIDALCINQNDTHERNEQVALMGDRYSKAKMVQIFLTTEDIPNYLGVVISGLAKNLRPGSPQNADFWHVHEACLLSRSVAFTLTDRETKETIEEDAFLEELGELFGSPWFQRVWVLQEVLKAQRGAVHVRLLHEVLVPWDDLMLSYFWYLQACEVRGQKALRSIPSLWIETWAIQKNRLVDESGIPTLSGGYMDILERFRRTMTKFHATDPRDKLYAILGLSDLASDPEPAITPDYNLSISQVYAKFTRACILHYGNLDALSVLHETTTSSNLACACPVCSEIHGRSADADHKADHPSWAIWPQTRKYWICSNLLAHDSTFRAAGETRVDEQLLLLAPHAAAAADDSHLPATLPLRGFFLEAVDNVLSPAIGVDCFDGTWTVCGVDAATGAQGPMALSETWVFLRDEYRRRATHHEKCIAEGARCRFDRRRADEDLFASFVETLLCRNPVDSVPDDATSMDDSTGGDGGGGGEGGGEEQHSRPTRIWQQPDVADRLAAHWIHAAKDPSMEALPPPVREDLRKRLPIRPGEVERLSEKFAEMVEPARGRVMFITRRGALGLCPIGTKSTDRPVVLFGGKVPFILRKIREEDVPDRAVMNGERMGDSVDEWKLIGECYIHGLMDGSRFEKLLDEGKESTVFYLR
ncbi:Heterokaryon incompatibility protein 6, OR allele [Diplodia seriata]|nr:Heterokaryon incompatibility protein 6, OR allele [Diplodia seriata]